jgi:hypothetical protein
MNTVTGIGVAEPALFAPSPHLADQVNRNIIESEIEGGVYLHDLRPGEALDIQTENRYYRLVNLGADYALLSGHPELCPDPVEVHIQGSTWGGSMLKERFVGRGMHLEFVHPVHRTITTSRVLDIRPCRRG